MNKKPKVIVILGPNSSGKSKLAVRLAKKFNGEIISADSRQIYKGMDIGTGKITRKEMRGAPHHLLDVARPKKAFTVVDYQRLAKKTIADILLRKKLPILCGGTGLYIDAVLHDIKFPRAKAEKKLHARLEKKSVAELFCELKQLDPRRAGAIDRHNKRRLIRALEILSATHTPIPPSPLLASTGAENEAVSPFHYLKIGMKLQKKDLRKRIIRRIGNALREGIIQETLDLHEKENLSWKRLEQFGLWYRFVSLFLQNKLPRDCYIQNKSEFKWPNSLKKFGLQKLDRNDLRALFACLSRKSWQYAKRQMTWWKRQNDIIWISNKKTAHRAVHLFLKN